MRWFTDLGIARKLAIAFGVLIAFMLVIGVMSFVQMTAMQHLQADVVGKWVPATRHLLSMKVALNEYRTAEIQQINFGADPEEVAGYEERIVGFKAQFDEQKAAYAALADSPEEQALFAEVLAAETLYFGLHSRITDAIAAGDLETARGISGEEGRVARRDLSARLDGSLELTQKTLEALTAEEEAATRRAEWAMGLAVLVATLAALGLGVWIARLVARPLVAAQRVAEQIANGRLDVVIPPGGGDETGHLLSAMAKMRDELRRVLEAMDEMARRHDAGELGYRMEAQRFPGDYGRMVEATNALVAGHIEVKLRVAALVSEYANGDLRRDMDELPGEKRRITEAMQAVKTRLSGINAQVQALADAAAAGDFSVRGDEAAFDHEFRRMVQGLNRVMTVSDVALAEVSRVLRAIAEGDLTQRVEGEFAGVFARMQADANASTGSLAAVVATIQSAVLHINTAAGEIASGNQDLSRRTEAQAANLEETAASMEELTSTVKQNAGSAQQANQLASSAAQVAGKGGQQIRDVVTTMEGISDSSRKVGEIISVIDGIAFQTNILALNAAVEAARAGEQGRGFAVVASEVRTLAQRSAAAAKEIKDLITDSIARVDSGSQLVHAAGGTMAEIVTSVRRVNDIMAEISAASAEQSMGIEQVNQTIIHLDETTQQNAALVEEATAAAQALEDQARQLGETVGRFRIEGR